MGEKQSVLSAFNKVADSTFLLSTHDKCVRTWALTRFLAFFWYHVVHNVPYGDCFSNLN